MRKQQADACISALTLLGSDPFTVTCAADNDLRPRVLSRTCKLGLTVSLHSVDAPADWSIKVLYRDLAKREAFEIIDIDRVTVDADTRSVFVWCRHNEHAFCFGLTPHKTSLPFELWNEAAKETSRTTPGTPNPPANDPPSTPIAEVLNHLQSALELASSIDNPNIQEAAALIGKAITQVKWAGRKETAT